MTNFDFLKNEPQFDTFADAAIVAEKVFHIDSATCVLNCRRAMEFAVKWMYSVDAGLEKPYQDTLSVLMGTEDFRDIVNKDILERMVFIRKAGNQAAHNPKTIKREQAELCLEDLFIFFDFVACCYADEYEERVFNRDLLKEPSEEPVTMQTPAADTIALDKLIAENKALKEELTARRAEQQQTYVPKPLDISEYETRKIYIDTMLQTAGWTENQDWQNEVELFGMPNTAGVGYADYVLYGDDGRALAVVEAKRTCVDVSKGRQQAKLYADILEKKHGRRPVIFLTNGFETRIDDGQYPERKIAEIYSKRDLEKLFNLRSMRTSLKYVQIDRDIAGRYYQEAAVKAVCDAFDRRNRRKALLVMATGSGKTRTVMALCDVLLKHGWVKNILFLADRNALVTQAKRAFVNLLPNLSVTNLCEKDRDYSAHCVFSTYQTMIRCIDDVRDDEGRVFSSGHFDLVICDEAHRSIYNKYKDIFNYFDAPLVGLTATPKDEVEKNTYEIFELANGEPTYGYELAQAVNDGYLVDYLSVETSLKFVDSGIAYDELSEEDKEAYENTFADEDGQMPETIAASAINEWVFNKDTIRKVLHILMTEGLHVDYGQKIGKTIIFAKNHAHAEKIYEVFNQEYPHLKDYAKVIDNQINYAQSAIDEFSEANKLPQIAISVDMLDTGIDVPEILNLVFFKKVMSKAKFWQMIGRGTRLCPGLLDNGEDKKKFYIFDFCGNFEFFRMGKGKVSSGAVPLQSAIFNIKAQMVSKLQDINYQTDELVQFRGELVDDMVGKVQELNRDNFAVRQHLKYVDMYSEPARYDNFTYQDTLCVKEEVSPLLQPEPDDASAVRFDALMYGIELAYLEGKKHPKARKDLMKRVQGIAGVANIPEIKAQSDFINTLLHTSYIEDAGINEFEEIRNRLRGLIKYVQVNMPKYETNFTDDILSMTFNEAELENDDLKNYKAKAEYYVRQHQDNIVIGKLRSNIPLGPKDIENLEQILWSEIGSRQDYEEAYGDKPLGEFVREIVGLDMKAAKEAFADYLDETRLDSRQIYFVNQIIEYIVHNGVMKDLSVLQEPPFTDRGSVVEIFKDTTVWSGIYKVIEKINSNAIA